MQDVVPKESRSIRNVSIERSRRRVTRPLDDEGYDEQKEIPDRPSPKKPSRKKVKRGGTMSKLVILGALVIILVLGGMMLFAGAKVTVVVREAPVFVDTLFDADKDAVDGLGYQVVTVTETAERAIPATGVEEVNTRASGKIIVFNDYGTKPQKLITNTRFETPDGLIYRIDRSVVVPGQSTDDDGKTIPGSIEVTVYADFPGDEYNVDLIDFTIPGLKGDPRYSKMYARSKTVMTGGFAGVRNVADEAELATAQKELQDELLVLTEGKLGAEIPEGFVRFDGTTITTKNSRTDGAADGNTVTVIEELSVKAAIFDAQVLAEKIADEVVADYDGTPVYIRDFSDLSVQAVLTSATDTLTLDGPLTLAISGSPHLVWTFNEDDLLTDLAGQKKEDVESILEQYPGIETAEIVVRPFWNSDLPERTSRIKIKIQQETE